MSLNTSGAVLTYYEKTIVPGDYVRLEKAWESDYWMGPPHSKEAPAPILNIRQPGQPGQHTTGPGMEIGGDPHKETINKISQALGGLMRQQEAIPTGQLLQRRDWR